MSYAIQFAQTGEADVLQKVNVELEDPGADQIRIRHSAIGLNFVDVYHRRGIYPLPLPAVPGVEGAGVVEAVGEYVTNVKVGDGSPTLGSLVPMPRRDSCLHGEPSNFRTRWISIWPAVHCYAG